MRRLSCNDDLPTGDTDTPYYNLSHTNGALSTPLRNIVCPSHHRQGDVSALHPHEVLLLWQVVSALFFGQVERKKAYLQLFPILRAEHLRSMYKRTGSMKDGIHISHKVPHWCYFLLPSAVSRSDKIPGLNLCRTWSRAVAFHGLHQLLPTARTVHKKRP
jgi:hypothetical protein